MYIIIMQNERLTEYYMKKWLKILICVLSAVLVLAVLGVAAAVTVTLTVKPLITNYEPGDELLSEIKVSSSQADAMGGYHVRVQYDTSVLSLDADAPASMKSSLGVIASATSTDTELASGFLVVNDEKDNLGNSTGYVDLVYVNADLGSAKAFSGVLATLKFTVKSTATVGTHSGAFAVISNEQYNASAASISDVTASGGSVNVVTAGSLVLGDVDGDGYVYPSDAMLVLRASVGNIALTAEQLERGDVDKDGLTYPADAMMILRYAVGILSSFS